MENQVKKVSQSLKLPTLSSFISQVAKEKPWRKIMKKQLFLSAIFILLISNNSAHAMLSSWEDEKAKPSAILKKPIHNPPQVCRLEDFKQPCHKSDQPCKTRKEKCTDEISAKFTEELLSMDDQMANLTIHNGKYGSTKGADDWRSGKKNGQKFHLVTENKADRSKLNRKNNQHSVTWNRNFSSRALREGNITQDEHDEFNQALTQGRVNRTLSHVSLAQDTNGEERLHLDYSLIVTQQDPKHYTSQMQTYCATIHPQISMFAEQHATSQPNKHRNTLQQLDQVCKTIPPVTQGQYIPTSYSTPRTSPEVCFVKTYSRENLGSFLRHLKESYRYGLKEIAEVNSNYSSAVIGYLIRDASYGKSKSYVDLWNSLITNFSEEFTEWESQ